MSIAAGVSCLGLVSHMPSGPGITSLDDIRTIIAGLPTTASSVLLTAATDPFIVAAEVEFVGADAVQLVTPTDRDRVSLLATLLPEHCAIIVVVHVIGPHALHYAKRFIGVASYLLLDTGDFTVSPMELGGTGRTHDWELSRTIVQTVPVPSFLAGGLTAANVSQAFDTVRPFGLDVCTGVRTRDELDVRKLKDFLTTAPLCRSEGEDGVPRSPASISRRHHT